MVRIPGVAFTFAAFLVDMLKRHSVKSVSCRRGERVWRSICIAGLGAAAAVCGPAITIAGLYYWTGDHDGNWNTTGGLAGTNWSSSPDFNNGTSALPDAGDNVNFVLFNAQNLTTSLGRDFSINGLTFTTDAIAANPIAIGGSNTLNLGAGGLTNNSNASVTLSTNVWLAATQTWTNNSVAQPLAFSGAISGAVGNNLILSGAGSFNFSGANTYAGATTLSTSGTALVLSGANGSLSNIAALTLNGGSTLVLDSSGANHATQNRLADSLGISMAGATLNLVGNSAIPTTETVGTVTVNSGASVISASGAGAALTLGATGTTLSLVRSAPATSGNVAAHAGGTVNFSVGSGAAINLPNVTLNNGIIGGWATVGKLDNTGALDFATVDGGGNVTPLSTYATTLGLGATSNVQLNSTVTGTTQAINSLYLTGGGNISFGTSNQLITIASGGIISNGATSAVVAANNQPAIPNCASIGIIGGAASGSLTTTGTDLIVTTSSNLQIFSTITGAIGLTKSGPGILDLSQQNAGSRKTNTYTGVTTINGGVIKVDADSNLGTAPTTFEANDITLNGGDLRTSSGFNFNPNRGITVGPQGGALSYVGGSRWVISQPITGPGGMTFTADSSLNTNTGSNVPFVILNNTGTPSNYTGVTVLKTVANNTTVPAGLAGYGVVQFGSSNQIPAGSAVTATAVGVDSNGIAGVVDLQGSTQAFGSLAGNMNIIGFTGSLTVGSNNGSTAYSGVLGFSGPSILPVTGSGTLSGAAATGSLTKVGAGTFTLSGSSGYTGPTNIGTSTADGGVLLIGSGTGVTSSASLGNTTVTVGSGVHSGTLGGNGTINGPVTVTSTGHLAPAMSATTTNILTIANNLTLNDGTTLDFNFGAAPASVTVGAVGVSDQVLQTSGFTASLNGSITLNVSSVSPSFGIGAYDLIDCSASAGTFLNTATFSVNGSTNFNYVVVSGGGSLDASVGGGVVPSGDVYLEVLKGNPTYAWAGSHSSAWNTSIGNWTSNGAGNSYSDGSNVSFDDSASGPIGIAVAAGGVSPNSMAFNNGSLAYTFDGGPINVTSGSGITKNQAASVTFNNTVTTPSLTVTSGSMVIGAAGAMTASTKVAVNGGLLTVNGSLTTPNLNVATNGTLSVGLNGSLNSNVALTVNGAAIFSNALQFVSSLTGKGAVNLNGGVIGFLANNTFDGTLTGTGGIEVDNGVVALSNGSNSYTGATTVNTGTLLLTNTSGSATGASAISVQSGGFLDGMGSASGTVAVAKGGQLQGTGTYSGLIAIGGTLSPAGDGQIGKLNLGTVSLNAGATLNFDLSGAGGNDSASVADALTLTGAETLNVNLLPGSTVGDYPLFTAVGGISDNATFTINATGSAAVNGVSYSVVTSGNQLLLRMSVPTLTWTGAVSNNWDFADSNWSTSPYSDASAVSFTDGVGNTTINVNAPVSPIGGIVFSNNIVNYVVTGQPIGGGGGLAVNGTASVTLGAGNTFTGATAINAGTLVIAADSSIGAAPAAATPGFLSIAAGATLAVTPGSANFALNANRGMTIGGAGGLGATIDVPAGTTLGYGGIIANAATQQGILNKTDGGELDLGGANTFSGGLNINGGAVKLTNATAAGSGPITVNNAGSILNLGANIANPVTLGSGAILGVTGAAQTLSGNLTVTGAATVDAFDAVTNGAANDVILTGMLLGAGNITVANQNTATPDNVGLRLRGPASTGPSAYSGTITLLPGSKFEIQTGAATGNPAGAATIVMNVGALSSTSAGSFSLVDLRNNAAGNTSLPNNYQLSGTNGAAVLNILGSAPAGSAVNLGSLQIGDTQALVAASTATTNPPYTAAFASVQLTGGNATFTPQPVGNTNYTGAENISLGPVTENVAKSGITMNGAATLSLTAANNYSGATTVQSGTLAVKAAGALPAASTLVVNGGSVDLNNGTVGNDQTIAGLAGSGGAITNSDNANLHTLVVNQSAAVGTTSYSGAISGNLSLTKSGNGTLQLLGAETYKGTTSVTAGKLVIEGSLNSAATVSGTGNLNVGVNATPGTISGAVTVGSGGTASGVGSTQALTVQTGGTLMPGNGGGVMAVHGALDLSAPNSHFVLQLGGTAASAYGSIAATGANIKLGGDVNLSFLGGGYTPAVGDTFYVIINGMGSAVSGMFSNAQVSGDVATTLGTYTDLAGDVFRVSYTANAALGGSVGFAPGQGQDVAFQVLSAVPEPGALPGLASGLGIWLGFRRLRNKPRVRLQLLTNI